jgi:pimeloyl-ACP methyl ester carboxylesterase
MNRHRMTRVLARRTRDFRSRFRRGFRRAVDDPAVPLSLDMGRDSHTLLIAFGGMRGQIGMPPFEFFKATGGIPVKRLFVRDLRQAWYHRGIPDVGATVTEVAEALERLIAHHDVDRTVVAGNSAGGYAALLFGTLLGVDTALCFAPQTVLDLDTLATMDDHRWDDQIRELVAAGALETRWADLRHALPQARRADTSYEIYYDDSFEVDRVHAERMTELEGVRLQRLQGGAHGIARDMRETGELERVLRRALGAPRQADATRKS